MNAIVPVKGGPQARIPEILVRAGANAVFAAEEFFKATVNQNVPLEDVQYLAGHSNPRTTQIYDRRRRRVTRNVVERISI
jgi:hypothetical protein